MTWESVASIVSLFVSIYVAYTTSRNKKPELHLKKENYGSYTINIININQDHNIIIASIVNKANHKHLYFKKQNYDGRYDPIPLKNYIIINEIIPEKTTKNFYISSAEYEDGWGIIPNIERNNFNFLNKTPRFHIVLRTSEEVNTINKKLISQFGYLWRKYVCNYEI